LQLLGRVIKNGNECSCRRQNGCLLTAGSLLVYQKMRPRGRGPCYFCCLDDLWLRALIGFMSTD
jgi:hypothetical protein